MRISDWSSDVCSADLLADGVDRLLELLAGDLGLAHGAGEALDALLDAGFQLGHRLEQLVGIAGEVVAAVDLADQRIAHRRQLGVFARSAERRVGKECVSTCRSRLSPDL